jgi:hypothetical protein
MNKITLFFLLLIYVFPVFAQDGFQFKNGANKVSISFQHINNLVFIPLNVNGVELTFLLDSGVKETILFSLDEREEVSLKNIQKVTLRGLGSEEYYSRPGVQYLFSCWDSRKWNYWVFFF